MTELKPCPFCGGEAKLEYAYMGHGAGGAFVQCLECGSQSRAFCARVDVCANDLAAEAWNRRHEDPKQELELDYGAED